MKNLSPAISHIQNMGVLTFKMYLLSTLAKIINNPKLSKIMTKNRGRRKKEISSE